MTFRFSRQGVHGRERVLQRVGEILPGAVSWTILLGMVVLACWRPLVAAVLVIAINLYWLLRLFYMTVFLVLSYLRLSAERDTDWMARVQGLDAFEGYVQALRRGIPRQGLGARVSQWAHRHDVEALHRLGQAPPPSTSIYHLVLVPVATEARAVLDPGLASLVRQTFPAQRILVVLAVEGRAAAEVRAGAEALREAYRHRFLDVLVVVHPDGVPGEARVKGANVTHAARAAAASFRAHGIPFDRVIASCFDADTVVHADYCACVTAHYLICPDRTRASFQPIPVYHNNIWEAPGFSRVLEIGSSFFQLVEATDPEQLVTFSSHSMSFQALVDIGYWPVDLISDDSAIFWKAYIHYDGRYRVVPMYTTVSMDVIAHASWWQTITGLYRQKRRWAWGVENFPIVVRAFLRARGIPVGARWRHAFKLLERNVAWATWPFLVTVIGWLPALFASREFSDSVVYYSAPRISQTIFNLALVSLGITILLSWRLLPPAPVRWPLMKRLGLACEWLLVPVIAVLLGALPALDAQTRLMMGRHLTFSVTDKPRVRRRTVWWVRALRLTRVERDEAVRPLAGRGAS